MLPISSLLCIDVLLFSIVECFQVFSFLGFNLSSNCMNFQNDFITNFSVLGMFLSWSYYRGGTDRPHERYIYLCMWLLFSHDSELVGHKF